MQPTSLLPRYVRPFCLIVSFIFIAPGPRSFAGQAQKWEQVPEAVRATILANGGTKEGRLDKESEKINGLVVYEAVGKDKKGREVDLVITSDGKLAEMKDDDAPDRAAEQAARNKNMVKNLTFTHPRDITNQWLPLATLKQDILEGKEGDAKIRIERTAKPDVHRTFKLGKQSFDSFAVEDRESEDGELTEVALDFFAQADNGAVLYLGEEVDEYKNGKVVNHSGSWMLGKDTKKPGIIIPGNPQVGDRFRSEDVSKSIREDDEVVSANESVTTPAGSFTNCIKVKETLADGAIEYKYYAAGIGVVREQPSVGDVLLKSHVTAR